MQKENPQKRSAAEKLIRHLHAHIVSVWYRDGFVKLSPIELLDRKNFLFIGDEEERSSMEREMILIAERYLEASGKKGLTVIGVRVEERQVSDYDGVSVELHLKPNTGKGDFILITFASTNRQADFFHHTILPFAQFDARDPLFEPPFKTPAPASIGQERPIQVFSTVVGTVRINMQTGTLEFKTADGTECSFSWRTREIRRAGRKVVLHKDVPMVFVSAVNAIRERDEQTKKIADLFDEDYENLEKKAPVPEVSGTRSSDPLENSIKTSDGMFTFPENGHVVYTGDNSSLACEFVPEREVIRVNLRIVKKHTNIPHEFLAAVVEARTQLSAQIVQGISNAVLDCIPDEIRQRMGNVNAVIWCLRQ